MNYQRIIFGLLFLCTFIIFSLAQAFAGKVLIKLILETPSDYEKANSLGVVAYQKIESLYLVEFDSDKLSELDQTGLPYQIIDENPWSEGYFLVSLNKGIAKVDFNLYGDILLTEQKWQIIKASPEEAFELMKTRHRIAPILQKPIPLKYKPQLKMAESNLVYSTDIQNLVNMVSPDSMRNWIQRLQNFYTRCTFSDSIPFARQWIYNKFKSFGIGQVKVDTFYYYNYVWNLGWHYLYNVRAVVPGTIYPNRYIIVGAHYDSYGNGCFDGFPNTPSPGADDDASGTSAVMELARIINAHPLKCSVIFIAFDAEEPWMDGSYSYVWDINNQGIDLDLMINLDMIGYTNDAEPDVDINHGLTTVPYGQIMAYAANQYTWLSPRLLGPQASDSWPFYEYGYNVLYPEEGDFNTVGYHTPGDVIAIMDIPYLAEVAKMGLATVVYVSDFPSPVGNIVAKHDGNGHTIYLNWSPNPPQENVVYYKVYYGRKSGEYENVHQVSATYDTLRNLIADTTYYITVTAVDGGSLESPAAYEASVMTRIIPLPPTGLVANPWGKLKIKLDWNPNQEMDLDYYKVYRSVSSGTGFSLLSGEIRDTTFVDSTVQGGVEYYYYKISAVDTSGNESSPSTEAKSFVISFDQGILLVDMTWGGDFGPEEMSGVNGDSVNAFYQRALQGYDYDYLDRSNMEPALSLFDLKAYSIAIVHSEDELCLSFLSITAYDALKQYLALGGALLIEGRRATLGKPNQGQGFIHFLPTDFGYEYLALDSAYLPPFWFPSQRIEEFIGAERTGGMNNYPQTVDLDTSKVNHAYDPYYSGFEGKVPGVGYIKPFNSSEVMYTFISAQDSTSSSRGDVNQDEVIDIGDIVYLISYVFYSGTAPVPLEIGNVNCDEEIDIGDIVYLINYVFYGGPNPCGQGASASQGKPVALKHFVTDSAIIYFGFSLSLVKEEIATQILHQAITDLQNFTKAKEKR
jgi:hypothetical protein